MLSQLIPYATNAEQIQAVAGTLLKSMWKWPEGTQINVYLLFADYLSKIGIRTDPSEILTAKLDLPRISCLPISSFILQTEGNRKQNSSL